LALCACAIAGITPAAHAACAAALADDCKAVRTEIAALLPDVRIDDARLDRALGAPPHRPCRNLSLVWRATAEVDAGAAVDGKVEFVHQSVCRAGADPRAPARLTGKGILIVALGRDRTLLWWREQPDPRDVRPLLPPEEGASGRATAARRSHAQRLRAGAALFDVPIPANVRIDVLELYDVRRADGRSTPMMLGRVEVPPR
jgi:hypothetical protein